MYQAFKAVVTKGQIKPLEKIKLKESTSLLITIVDPDEYTDIKWPRLSKWIRKQKKGKKYTSYSSIEASTKHLRHLFNEN